MRNITMIALLLLGLPTSAAASDFQNPSTGNALLADCEDTGGFNHAFCEGYILGFTRLADGLHSLCIPAGVSNGQIFDVVQLGLKNHPEEREKEANVLMFKYLKSAFPCPSR